MNSVIRMFKIFLDRTIKDALIDLRVEHLPGSRQYIQQERARKVLSNPCYGSVQNKQ